MPKRKNRRRFRNGGCNDNRFNSNSLSIGDSQAREQYSGNNSSSWGFGSILTGATGLAVGALSAVGSAMSDNSGNIVSTTLDALQLKKKKCTEAAFEKLGTPGFDYVKELTRCHYASYPKNLPVKSTTSMTTIHQDQSLYYYYDGNSYAMENIDNNVSDWWPFLYYFAPATAACGLVVLMGLNMYYYFKGKDGNTPNQEELKDVVVKGSDKVDGNNEENDKNSSVRKQLLKNKDDGNGNKNQSPEKLKIHALAR